MTIHDIVSPAWTAEEAIQVCDLLDALRAAIWRVHARAIHEHAQQCELREAFEAELNPDP